MYFDLNLNSTEKFDQDFGDSMPLDEFIDCCESGSFSDYDGYASEIILNGNVIYDDSFYPTDVNEHKDELLQIQAEHGQLQVVWYNR